MTEQEIIQKAEEYANSMYDKKYQSELWKECYMTHIAGEHSRDEEVKELKEEIESLQEQYKTCFDGFLKRGTKLGELMKENVELKKRYID